MNNFCILVTNATMSKTQDPICVISISNTLTFELKIRTYVLTHISFIA